MEIAKLSIEGDCHILKTPEPRWLFWNEIKCEVGNLIFELKLSKPTRAKPPPPLFFKIKEVMEGGWGGGERKGGGRGQTSLTSSSSSSQRKKMWMGWPLLSLAEESRQAGMERRIVKGKTENPEKVKKRGRQQCRLFELLDWVNYQNGSFSFQN